MSAHTDRHGPDARHDFGAPACPCWDCRVTRAADRALATDDVVTVGDLVLVPDIVLIEAKANGLETPETWTLGRADGRLVHVYAVDAEPDRTTDRP
jgi:hypothetical protein